MQVSKEQIKQARAVNLRDYLMAKYPGTVKLDSNGWASLKDDKSMRVREGFRDMSSGESGNAIEYLVNYKDYTFPEAVAALLDPFPVPVIIPEEKKREKPKENRSNDFVQSYLRGRGIDGALIDDLVCSGLLYQDKNDNCVFISHKKNYAEIRASNEIPMKDTGKPYRGNWVTSGFCWDLSWGSPKIGCKAYICESAIDAISLAQLRKEDAFYISVGGAGQKGRIRKLLESGLPCEFVLAVDNDEAGERCRQEHAELPAIIPEGAKDWNELLKKGEKHEG